MDLGPKNVKSATHLKAISIAHIVRGLTRRREAVITNPVPGTWPEATVLFTQYPDVEVTFSKKKKMAGKIGSGAAIGKWQGMLYLICMFHKAKMTKPIITYRS